MNLYIVALGDYVYRSRVGARREDRSTEVYKGKYMINPGIVTYSLEEVVHGKAIFGDISYERGSNGAASRTACQIQGGQDENRYSILVRHLMMVWRFPLSVIKRNDRYLDPSSRRDEVSVNRDTRRRFVICDGGDYPCFWICACDGAYVKNAEQVVG